MTKAALQGDLTVVMPGIVVGLHSWAGVSPPFALPTGPGAELPTPNYWPPGFALGRNKFTTTVFHKMQLVSLEGHDVGVMIPHFHVLPSPLNALTPVQLVTSRRASKFSTSKVRMNGKAASAQLLVSWPPAPMLYCADPVSIPMGDTPTALLNSVNMNLTWSDFAIGVVASAARMLIDFAFKSKLSPGEKLWQTTGGVGKEMVWKELQKQLFKEGIKSAGKKAVFAGTGGKKWIAKQVASNLVGNIKTFVTGEGSYGIKVTSDGKLLKVGAGVNLTPSSDPGQSAKIKLKLGLKSLVSAGVHGTMDSHKVNVGSTWRTFGHASSTTESWTGKDILTGSSGSTKTTTVDMGFNSAVTTLSKDGKTMMVDGGVRTVKRGGLL